MLIAAALRCLVQGSLFGLVDASLQLDYKFNVFNLRSVVNLNAMQLDVRATMGARLTNQIVNGVFDLFDRLNVYLRDRVDAAVAVGLTTIRVQLGH